MNFNEHFHQKQDIFVNFMVKIIGIKVVLCLEIKMAWEQEIVLA